jgi:hypothetical protein
MQMHAVAFEGVEAIEVRDGDIGPPLDLNGQFAGLRALIAASALRRP